MKHSRIIFREESNFRRENSPEKGSRTKPPCICPPITRSAPIRHKLRTMWADGRSISERLLRLERRDAADSLGIQNRRLIKCAVQSFVLVQINRQPIQLDLPVLSVNVCFALSSQCTPRSERHASILQDILRQTDFMVPNANTTGRCRQVHRSAQKSCADPSDVCQSYLPPSRSDRAAGG